MLFKAQFNCLGPGLLVARSIPCNTVTLSKTVELLHFLTTDAHRHSLPLAMHSSIDSVMPLEKVFHHVSPGGGARE